MMSKKKMINFGMHIFDDFVLQFIIQLEHVKWEKKMIKRQLFTPSTQVKGVKGLRVVDASIMPDLVLGNTNIPIIALVERAADLIKNNI